MASGSEDSDDEPLSVLAALKQRDNLGLEITPVYEKCDAKTKSVKRHCDVSIALQPINEPSAVVEKPTDVWLYLTDFSPTGPYSCLLCSEWFINRIRIVIHYAVDHKKDYCGVCRYFVPNREAWHAHLKLHIPYKCSQCSESFSSPTDLRVHFSSVHNLVHCCLCHLRLPDDDQYRNHLLQKHFVKEFKNATEQILWNFHYKGSQKFECQLCLKSVNIGRQFADHYISYHHFTLRCFMHFVSGADIPFNIKGADLTAEFISTQLNAYSSYGYVDFIKTVKVKEGFIQDDFSNNTFTALVPFSENEEMKFLDEIKGYKGDEDFDVTLTELIVLHQCYYDYVNEISNEINSNIMPPASDISYINSDGLDNVRCCFCHYECTGKNALEIHMTKAHGIKNLPIYWCRVCAAVFDSLTELEAHVSEELGEFEDLWICQFCEKEFDNREETRKHLTKHWSEIEYNNCFSPHLGFKCKYCPILFWNETDRELHHVEAHFQIFINDFYKCMTCGEVFGDKVFFIHHYIDQHDGDQLAYLIKCCVCCMVLRTVDEMRAHFEAEHPTSRKIFCSLDRCKFRPFSHRKSFLLHIKSIHLSQPSSKFTCPTCGMKFGSAKARTVHRMQAHAPGKIQCNLCNEVLQTTDERRIHYLIRHPGRYEYQCEDCNKSFQYKSSLYMHKQEHAAHKASYACNYCGKVFLKRDSYREHIQIHQAPRHACSYCPMRFVQRSNMLRHERRHTGERPYACKYCPRAFSDKGACTSHLRTHIKTTKYPCPYCGQTFVQKSKLNYHTRKHTGENLETCSLCSKTFTSACSLREHMRIHQRQKMKKTFKCPLCNNMYAEEKEVLRHMRASHTGAKYQCPLCDKVVTSAGSLRDHVVTHSRLKIYRCKLCPKSYHSKKSISRHIQKRHGIKASDVKCHFQHLEPKDCNLGLDDDLMDKIFGNLKKKRNPAMLMAELANLKNKNKNTENVLVPKNASDEPDEQSDEESDKESEVTVREEHVLVKIEPTDEDDDQEELPPPDFVNVKIEPVDENDMFDTDMADD